MWLCIVVRSRLLACLSVWFRVLLGLGYEVWVLVNWWLARLAVGLGGVVVPDNLLE